MGEYVINGSKVSTMSQADLDKMSAKLERDVDVFEIVGLRLSLNSNLLEPRSLVFKIVVLRITDFIFSYTQQSGHYA
jgi:hypothetical protein